jgi:coenzyme PQQ biosynthesis protein PqqD
VGERPGPAAHPRLARKARLRFDRQTDRYMLLYPEKGLLLNPTAADVLKLCTGERSVTAIAAALASAYARSQADVEREVLEFLGAMMDRGLVEDAGPPPERIEAP